MIQSSWLNSSCRHFADRSRESPGPRPIWEETMVRTIRLTEYITSHEVPLELEERDALRALVRTLTITPSAGTSDHYDLTPSGTVGVLRLNDLQVEIRPK